MSDYLPSTKRLNICVLGEVGVGKSSLIIKYAQSHFPEDHDPTLQETYSQSVKFDHHKDDTVNGDKNNDYSNNSNDDEINTNRQVQKNYNNNKSNRDNYNNRNNNDNNNNNGIFTTDEHSMSAVEKADEDTYRLDILDTVGIEDYSELRENQIQEADAIIFCYDVTSKASYDIVTILHQQVLRCREDFLPPMVLCGARSDLVDNRQLSYEDGEILARELNLDLFIETSAKLNVNVEECFIKTAKLIIKSKESQTPIALDGYNNSEPQVSINNNNNNNNNNNQSINQQESGYMTASNSVNNIAQQSIATKHSSSQTRAMQSSAEPSQVQKRGIAPSSNKTNNNSHCCIIM